MQQIRNVSGHPVLFARHTGDYGLAGIEPPSLDRTADKGWHMNAGAPVEIALGGSGPVADLN
ncbi:MAG TPA: hypothetical protein VFS81_18145, partial [Candidatus Binatia bacterium]|nr:hypothetical protein [Candidatus Binatia bacterium]